VHNLTRTALVLGACLVTIVSIATVERAFAQVSPYRVQQRYNEATKGADIDDWARRMKEEDPHTRLEAVKSFGESNDPEAIEHLIEAMADTDRAVRIKAIDYLGKLRATQATTLMVQKLFLRDIDAFDKQRILVALGRIGDVKAIGPVSDFLEQDTDPTTRATAVFALGEFGDRATIEKLQKVQVESNDPNMERLAGEAVAKINRRLSPSTVAVTVPALEEDQPSKPQAATP
jgi:HEAT repeat protein